MVLKSVHLEYAKYIANLISSRLKYKYSLAKLLVSGSVNNKKKFF